MGRRVANRPGRLQTGFLIACLFVWPGLTSEARAQCAEPDEILPADASGNMLFGWALSADGPTAAVGAWLDRPFGIGSGSAYAFRLGPTGWIEEEKLIASDGATGSRFGISTAVSGSRMLIGASKHEVAGARPGAAYLFAFNGPLGWVQTARFTPSDGTDDASFGFRVALQGSLAVIGAPNQQNGIGQEAGAVYVFERIGGNWAERQILRATGGQHDDDFGVAVDLDGQRIVVGASGADDSRGAVYIFERGSGGWSQVERLAPGELDPGDQFGVELALDDERLAVSAVRDADFAMNGGAVYVFDRNEGDWPVSQKLFASQGSSPRPYEFFGIDLALDGERMLISARGAGAGIVYVFRRTRAGWGEERRITANDSAFQDLFGVEVAMPSGWVLVGAPQHTSPGLITAGKLYAFQAGDFASPYCYCAESAPCANEDAAAGCANSTGGGSALRACGSPSVLADDLVLWAERLPADRVVLLAMGDERANSPFGSGRLCVEASTGGFHRFPVQKSDATGGASFGPGLVSTSAQLMSIAPILAGTTQNFQLLFRDPISACAPFGASTALSIPFTP